MKSTTTYEMKLEIARDFNITDLQTQEELIISPKTTTLDIKHFVEGRANQITFLCLDGSVNNYLTTDMMNRRKFVLDNAKKLVCTRNKTFHEIVKESGVVLKTTSCKICEGGGWHSQGVRYEYKDTYVEF